MQAIVQGGPGWLPGWTDGAGSRVRPVRIGDSSSIADVPLGPAELELRQRRALAAFNKSKIEWLHLPKVCCWLPVHCANLSGARVCNPALTSYLGSVLMRHPCAPHTASRRLAPHSGTRLLAGPAPNSHPGCG